MSKKWMLFLLLFWGVSKHLLADSLNYDVISLNVKSTEKVERDELILDFVIQEQGVDRQTVSDVVTRKINQFIDTTKKYDGFNVWLQNRSAQQIDVGNRGKTEQLWRDVAIVQVRSKKFEQLNMFAAKIQPVAAIGNVSYVVSDELLQKKERDLLQQVLLVFQQKSRELTQYLGARDYKIVSVRVGNGYVEGDMVSYVPRMMSAKLVEGTQTASGQTQLSLEVDGQIQLVR